MSHAIIDQRGHTIAVATDTIAASGYLITEGLNPKDYRIVKLETEQERALREAQSQTA
jgi:hypothetical protein